MTPSKQSPVPRWLGVIIALQVMTLISQWAISPGAAPVQAQVPDAGAQRFQMIDQQKATNEKLDKLISLLSSGDLQVKVAKPDEK